MDNYPVELDAEQIVRWLIDEQRAGHRELQVTASRSYMREDIPTSQQQRRRLGKEELEDISEVTAIGTLEIAPLHENEGWLLRIRIEDALGDRLSGEMPSSDEPDEIDLDSFQQEFILPGSGTAFVSADAETPEAWALCQKLLADVQVDRHNK